jgi:hypothetical protein
LNNFINTRLINSKNSKMKKNWIIRLLALSMSVCITLNGYSQIIYPAPQKKLIDFGWHSPFATEIRDNIKKFEINPFDGVTIKLSKDAGGGNVFMINVWKEIPEATKERERKIVESIPQSSVLTDNFIVLYGASQLNWFSDSDWVLVDQHLRYAAQLAKACKCKGILWDPEPYKPGKNPWRYREQDGNAEISYQKFYDQVRKRGAQFVKALQEEFPGIVILSLREISDLQDGSPFSQHLLPVLDSQKAIRNLENAWWGLHLPFTIGIMDAINPDVEFIDANEEAYFYTSAIEYYKVRDVLKNDARELIPAELHLKYASHYQIGHAISADYTAGNWLGISSFPYRLKAQAKMLTPEQRAQWFEHNAYYALRTSDKYVWLYTERANWWTGENVPEGFAEALIRAKNKAVNREPLGFSVDEMLKEARDKAEKFEKENKKLNK